MGVKENFVLGLPFLFVKVSVSLVIFVCLSLK